MPRSGFTLVELLIVIAIAGVISSSVIIGINPGQKLKSSRDAIRLTQITSIRTALTSYYALNGNFPASSSGGVSSCTASCGGWEVAGCGVPFLQTLRTSGDFGTDINDPSMNGSPTVCHNIRYYRYAAGSYGCDASKGEYYVLGITDMETTSNPYPGSPGWSCPGRNWQGEFDWVTGAFRYP